jgi:hypothetical protein
MNVFSSAEMKGRIKIRGIQGHLGRKWQAAVTKTHTGSDGSLKFTRHSSEKTD